MTRSMNRATNTGLAPALIALLTVGVSGCVTQTEFNQYKQEIDQRLAQQAAINQNLDDHVNAVDCELNTDLVSNDEPDPTRRDEPSATRRDECEQRTSEMKSDPQYEACKITLKACLESAAGTQCYQDFQTCIAS